MTFPPPPAPAPAGPKVFFRGARAAFVFLTRIPVGGHPFDRAEWAWAAAHFPLVGLALGAAMAAVQRALSPVGGLADSILVIAVSLLLTGALHEDGLADTCDALGGGRDRQSVLEILKDSRVGVYGAAALTVSLVGRSALLAQLGTRAGAALVVVGCVSRVAPVWQMVLLPYVTRAGAKSRDIAQAGPAQALVATAYALAALGVARGLGVASVGRLLALVGAVVGVTVVSGMRYAKRAGGVTGDFLGATEQLCELAGYVVFAWSAP